MAKREDDGTISLHRANEEQRKIDRELNGGKRDAAEIAKKAIDGAFQSPLDRPRGGRTQKNLRAHAE